MVRSVGGPKTGSIPPDLVTVNAGASRVPTRIPGEPPELAPSGHYLASTAAAGTTSTAAGSKSILGMHLAKDDELPAQRLRRHYGEIIEGKEVRLPASELLQLQAFALSALQQTFTNTHGNDGALLSAVGDKLSFYSSKRPDATTRATLTASKSTLVQQQDALAFVLRTFKGHEPSDDALRRAAFDKLGAVGRRSDVAAIMPHLRKGTSSDLYHGLEAIKAITGRKGVPFSRGGLIKDPVVGPLLMKDKLDAAESTRVIEAVLARGEIKRVKKLEGAGNKNPVYFVTFKETIPGPGGKRENIQGVFKPETAFVGKDRAYFSREVAAYRFDAEFAKTGLVPPTVESLMPIGGGPAHELGSMQYRVPHSAPLGGHPPGSNLDSPANYYDPQHDAFRQTDRFKQRMAQVRTLAFVFDDPDKLKNNVFENDNLANLLVTTLPDGSQDLRMIDNSLSIGRSVRPESQVDKGMLPKKAEPELLQALEKAAPDEVSYLLASYVREQDAQRVADRMGVATTELEKRK